MGDHIRRKRLDLGQGQRTLALQLGVREETVYLWETGRAWPLPRHYGRIVWFLGYDPEPRGPDLGERIRASRRRCGLTQAELAVVLGADEGTVVDLEANQSSTEPENRGGGGGVPPQARWRRTPCTTVGHRPRRPGSA